MSKVIREACTAQTPLCGATTSPPVDLSLAQMSEDKLKDGWYLVLLSASMSGCNIRMRKERRRRRERTARRLRGRAPPPSAIAFLFLSRQTRDFGIHLIIKMTYPFTWSSLIQCSVSQQIHIISRMQAASHDARAHLPRCIAFDRDLYHPRSLVIRIRSTCQHRPLTWIPSHCRVRC